MDISAEEIDSFVTIDNYISQYVYKIDRINLANLTGTRMQGTEPTKDDYVMNPDGSISFLTGILLRDKSYFGRRKQGLKIPPPPLKIREVKGVFVCDPLKEYINLPESVYQCFMFVDKAKLSNIKMEICGESLSDVDVEFCGSFASVNNVEFKYTGVKHMLRPGENVGGINTDKYPCVQFTGISDRIMKGFTFKFFSFIIGMTRTGKNLSNELYNAKYNQYKDVVFIRKKYDTIGGTWLYNNGNEFEVKHY